MRTSNTQPFTSVLDSFEERLAQYEKWQVLWIESPEEAAEEAMYDADELDEMIIETQESIQLLKSDINMLLNQDLSDISSTPEVCWDGTLVAHGDFNEVDLVYA